MKKIIYSLLFIVCLTGYSCNEYLDIKPYGKAIPETAEEFSSILHGHLNNVDYGTDQLLIGNSSSVLDFEMFSDNFNATLTFLPEGSGLPIYVGSRINSMQLRYQNLYAIIRDANIIISNMAESEAREDRNVLGTAYAMRGITYFTLLREFCEPFESNDQLGLPLVVDFDMEERPLRSNYGATAAQIERDLNKAISLKVDDEIFRLTEDATKAYLARFYLWTRQWEKAAPLAEELLANYPLLTGEAYKTMIQARNEKSGNVLIRSYLFRGGGADIEDTNNQSIVTRRPVHKDLIDLFHEKEADIRFELFFDSRRLNKKVLTSKVRTAEMALIAAESYAHLQQPDRALVILNDLRSKRIQPYTPLTINTLPAVNGTSLIKVDAEGKALTPLLQAILNERRKELYAEGDRWFELKRNGRPSFWASNNGLKYETQEYLYTFPLPRIDIELIDGLTQNPGYQL